MASWSHVEREAPDLAKRARACFDAHGNKTLATLRRDGSPRISGTECQFRRGDLWIGSMPGAVKALDLRRDPRYALHSGSDEPADWGGDAKVAGRAEEVDDEAQKDAMRVEGQPAGDFHLFRLDISELATVALNEEGTRLVIESWHEGRGVERRERT